MGIAFGADEKNERFSRRGLGDRPIDRQLPRPQIVSERSAFSSGVVLDTPENNLRITPNMEAAEDQHPIGSDYVVEQVGETLYRSPPHLPVNGTKHQRRIAE